MPMYAYNPRLRKLWNDRIRRINRIFKEMQLSQDAPRVRLSERKTA